MAPLSAPAALAPQDLAASPQQPSTKDLEAARQFEGMLMAQLFQSLRKTVQPSGLFGGQSQARGTYEYLLDQAVVNHAMEAGKGWGLSERILDSWKLQNLNS